MTLVLIYFQDPRTSKRQPKSTVTVPVLLSTPVVSRLITEHSPWYKGDDGEGFNTRSNQNCSWILNTG